MKKTYLKQFMASVPTGDYKDVKDRIIDECRITGDIWANWLSGRTAIPPLAKEKIEQISIALAEQGIGHRLIFDEKEAAQVGE